MAALAAAALTLVLTDVQALPLSRPTVERAVAAALAGSDLDLSWDAEPPGVGRLARAGEVRIILLNEHPRRARELVLGAVLPDRTNTDALWVYVGGIRRVLEDPESGSSNRLQLSIAVGRVIAHEIAHLVAPRQPHAGEGLMSRMVDRRILLQAEAPLDANCRAAIRSAAAMGLGPALKSAIGSSFTIRGTADLGITGLKR